METTALAKVARKSNRGSAPGERRGGRQKGTPNKSTGEVREIARIHGPAAIKAAAKLAGLVMHKETGEPDGMATNEQARLTAIGIILDRAYGKAAQPLVGEDGEGPVAHKITWEVIGASETEGSK